MGEQQEPVNPTLAPPSVEVPVKHWYQSRELMIGLIQFVFFFATGLESAIKAGNSVSVLLLTASALGAVTATIKALAPNIITGLAIFDGGGKEK